MVQVGPGLGGWGTRREVLAPSWGPRDPRRLWNPGGAPGARRGALGPARAREEVAAGAAS